MKKFALLTLALIMAMCMVACGEQPAAGVNSEPATEPTTAPVVTTEPTVAAIEVEDVVSEMGGYLQYTYSDHVLNEKGQVISRKVSGDSRRTDTFEYDDQGRVVKCTRTSSYGDDIWTYTYDENGLLVEEFQGDRTFLNTYTMDEQGRVVTKKSVNKDSNYTMIYTYTYNDDGTVATETQKSPNSTYVITFTYDAKGRVATAKSVKEGASSGVTTRYTYAVVGSYVPET